MISSPRHTCTRHVQWKRRRVWNKLKSTRTSRDVCCNIERSRVKWEDLEVLKLVEEKKNSIVYQIKIYEYLRRGETCCDRGYAHWRSEVVFKNLTHQKRRVLEQRLPVFRVELLYEAECDPFNHSYQIACLERRFIYLKFINYSCLFEIISFFFLFYFSVIIKFIKLHLISNQ